MKIPAELHLETCPLAQISLNTVKNTYMYWEPEACRLLRATASFHKISLPHTRMRQHADWERTTKWPIPLVTITKNSRLYYKTNVAHSDAELEILAQQGPHSNNTTNYRDPESITEASQNLPTLTTSVSWHFFPFPVCTYCCFSLFFSPIFAISNFSQ